MIKLLVDSASDITQIEAAQMGLALIPLEINFAEGHYFDGVDLTAKDFYNKLVESAEIPKTSQINSFRFAEKFQELTQSGDEVLCLTLSSNKVPVYCIGSTIGTHAGPGTIGVAFFSHK